MARDDSGKRSRRTTSRRRLLQGAATLGAAGLAGCGQLQSVVGNGTGGIGGGGTPTVATGPDVTDPTPVDCEPEVVSGDIQSDTTWSADDCPRVALDGNVRVTNEATLTIESGVEIVGRSGTRLTVLPDGNLVASGDPENPVWFHGEADATGYWQGINVRSATPSELDNVIVRHGGANNWANVYLSGDGQVSLTNVLSERSATAGLVAESGTTLTDFAANEFGSNEDAAVYIPTALAGAIDAGSTYVGDNGVDAVGVFSQDVEEDATWPGVPYRFDGNNHRITTGAVTVEPGAEFTFGSGARITVLPEGSFAAAGTSDAPITFVGGSATPGYWQGINVRSNNPDNTLANVEVAHGGANNWANVYLSGSAQVAVTDSTFRQCATSGIVAESGTTFREFSTNEFRSNENDALYVPTALVGSLDADSTYVGDNGVDAVGVFSQDVEEDATWPGVPYRFDGNNHRVTTGAVTVEPGAEFTFGSGARITVLPDGAFTAEGTSDSPISFVGESATPGHWQGINIRSNNQNNTLANVEVAHGGANNWANVYLSGSARATITDSTLRDSATWGLFAEDGTTLESSSNVFENNGEGGVRTPQA